MADDYNGTLNLPKTDFPMRAGLPQREPGMLEQWESMRLYDKLMARGASKPLYVFHDGPPYANADIHLGTALNKVLKDIIVRYKNMAGFKTHFIPGWDTHGLPIERKAITQLRESGQEDVVSDPLALRKACKEFALFHVENQKKQFLRLGTLADYDHPYLTLEPAYEARQVEIFGAMARGGYIYKDLKSVYWCPDCATALAEAEIEYAEDKCSSIYVKFPVKADKEGTLARMGAGDISKVYFVIWTTTTWTLPANLAICLGPDFEYCLVEAAGEYYVLARELAAATMEAAGIEDYTVLGSAAGKQLEYLHCRHPFLDRDSLVILGHHVTLDSGTGCVHTAPGHGVEDFDVCSRYYPQLGCVVPVDEHGKMTEEAGAFLVGQTTEQANKTILRHLKRSGLLLAVKRLKHQYPHCWRCKEPVLFRATEQWFCSVEDFKNETIEEINKVQFIPAWGRGRMEGMVQDRDAWCISRQRTWGVPIPVFYCDHCGSYIVNDNTIASVSKRFREEGSDAWFLHEAADLLPDGYACPSCECKHFTKETDTMDVWFDSGVSHASVLENGPDQTWPSDLYLEGTDQYRGWFQSSLLTAVAWRGKAPYKAICTHGWVVDGEGRKMSKSLGNGMDPGDVIKDFGADILRLWVASSDYHADVRISTDILKQLSEAYRKIRNTARFILGNLSDFDPVRHEVADEELPELDRWALARLQEFVTQVRGAYDRFDFHIVYHALHNFCTIELSNFYLDLIKDRLYVEAADSPARRAAQTAMYRILRALTLLIAPIVPFTAEEIWGHIPADKRYDAESVMFNEVPAARKLLPKEKGLLTRWNTLIAVRDDVNKALELARAEKKIGKSLEAKVQIYCSGKTLRLLKRHQRELPTLFIVSQVELSEEGRGDVTGEVEGLSVHIAPADGVKCERCWSFRKTVGQNAAHATLCDRCAEIVD